MAKDVKITPAAGKVEFQNSSTNYAYISGDASNDRGKIFIGTEETGVQKLQKPANQRHHLQTLNYLTNHHLH